MDLEVVVGGGFDTLDGAPDIGVVDLLVEVAHAGVCVGSRAVDDLGLAALVGAPDITDERNPGATFGLAPGAPDFGLRPVSGLLRINSSM